MTQYETVFIMTPVLSEDNLKETAKSYRKLLESKKAKIIAEENWGLRKLSYPIQKKSTGYYYSFQFESEGDIIDPLEIAYVRDERIMRFLTFRLDKHSISFNDRRRKGEMKNSVKKAVKKEENKKPGRKPAETKAANQKETVAN